METVSASFTVYWFAAVPLIVPSESFVVLQLVLF